jgi:hypothetical protein
MGQPDVDADATGAHAATVLDGLHDNGETEMTEVHVVAVDAEPSPSAIEAGLAALYATGAVTDASTLGAWAWVLKRVFSAMISEQDKVSNIVLTM